MNTQLRPEIIRSFHDKPFSTPVIGVTGGKGGVGKTTVAVNLAAALVNLGHRVAFVDCDVDAPNGAILLSMQLEEPISVNVTKPIFDTTKCTDCNACIEACFLVCPEEAISRGDRSVGTTYKTVSGNLTVFTGTLHPGFEESALVVTALKKRAFDEAEQFDIILVDTSPGTHCNVINALKGSDNVIAVTEPTPLGSHDLDLILSLLDMFEVKRSIFINRSDLPGNIPEIKKVADAHNTQIETGLRLDDQLLQSYVEGVPIVQLYPMSLAAMTFTNVAKKYTHSRIAT